EASYGEVVHLPAPASASVLVVLGAQVSDQVLTHHVPEVVLELLDLDEDVVLGIHLGSVLGALEVERQPLLDSRAAGAVGQVHEQGQIQDQGSGQDRVFAQKVDLDLHRISQPSEDVDVVPAFLVVTPRRV